MGEIIPFSRRSASPPPEAAFRATIRGMAVDQQRLVQLVGHAMRRMPADETVAGDGDLIQWCDKLSDIGAAFEAVYGQLAERDPAREVALEALDHHWRLACEHVLGNCRPPSTPRGALAAARAVLAESGAYTLDELAEAGRVSDWLARGTLTWLASTTALAGWTGEGGTEEAEGAPGESQGPTPVSKAITAALAHICLGPGPGDSTEFT